MCFIFFMLLDHLIIGMQIGSSTLVYTKRKLHLFFVALTLKCMNSFFRDMT